MSHERQVEAALGAILGMQIAIFMVLITMAVTR